MLCISQVAVRQKDSFISQIVTENFIRRIEEKLAMRVCLCKTLVWKHLAVIAVIAKHVIASVEIYVSDWVLTYGLDIIVGQSIVVIQMECYYLTFSIGQESNDWRQDNQQELFHGDISFAGSMAVMKR